MPKNKEPIRSQVSSLTKILTLTTTQKFPPLAVADAAAVVSEGAVGAVDVAQRAGQAGRTHARPAQRVATAARN